MSTIQNRKLADKFIIETLISNIDNCERSKAYSTDDGKEVVFISTNIMFWKPEVVRCFLEALKAVREYKSCNLFLDVFGEEISEEEHVIRYVTENISENVSSVYAGIGSVRLTLIRKWLQELLKCFQDLHSTTDSHPGYIHGRIRLSHLLYFRSSGQLRIGGYYWLTKANQESAYPQCEWACDDDCIGYYAPEVFSDNLWTCAIDIYALAMCFVHLLSGCEPYGELDDNVFIKQAILSNQPPKGLQCIQEIDELLYQLLRDCLQPIDKRPTAEQLLEHPFFKDETNTEIDISQPRVQLHPNHIKESSGQHLFSKAFKREIPPIRPPEKEIRLSGNFLSLSSEPISSKKSTSQDNEGSAKNTEIYHLTVTTRKTYISSTGLSDKPPLSRQHSNGNEFTCKSSISNIICSVLLPCNLINPYFSGFLKLSLPITISQEAPWDTIHSAINQLNCLREANHLSPLSESEEWDIEEAICLSIQESLASIEKQQTSLITVYSYLNTILINKTISLYLPAFYINDDKMSDEMIEVKFPITSKNISFISFTSTITTSLINSIAELRKQRDLPSLTEKTKKQLVLEITTVLSLQLCQLIQDTQLHVFQVDSISATITHYQSILEKDSYSLLSVYNATEAIPMQSRLVINISIPLINPNNSIKTASLEFKCYHNYSKNKEVQDVILSILSQIDAMNVSCSDYERSLLQDSLKAALAKVLSSVKIEEVVIPEHITLNTESNAKTCKYCNEETIKSISVLQHTLNEVEEVILSNLPSLESINIAAHSFCKVRRFEIQECSKLVDFSVEKDSFNSLHELDLSYCSALQNLSFTALSFRSKGCSCNISNCSSLHTIIFEHFAFEQASSICIENCLQLKSIQMKDFACCGESDADVNRLILRNVPSLISADIPNAFQRRLKHTQISNASAFDTMDSIHFISYLNPLLPNTIDTILVREGIVSQEQEIRIEGYPILKELKIMTGCYKNATRFYICDCPKLVSIQIGDGCFQGEAGSCEIADCPSLVCLSIGESFSHFKEARLHNLPMLSSIHFGCWRLGNEISQSHYSQVLTSSLFFTCNSVIPMDTAYQFNHLVSLFKDSLCKIFS